MKRIFKKALHVSSLSLLAALSSAPLYAAGYKLEFQSPSVLADAGEAAVVNDASTNWYNAAGLVYLPHQIVGSIIDVYQRSRFTGTASAPSPVSAPGYNNTDASASAYPNSILPSFHYVVPFKERYALGISVVPAWGLMENYGENSDVRYNLNKVSTKTIDIAYSLAMKINDKWSVGLGPDLHYFSIQSRSHAYTSPLTANDSISRYNANNWGRGWHAGVLFRLDEATRIGLNYRSQIVMNLTGGSDFAFDGIAHYHTDQFKVSIPLPAVTTLSVYHDINPTWAVMGTLAYDQWANIQHYYGQNFTQPTGPTNVVLPQKFSNTIDVGVGAHYKLNDQWLLRGSLKFEPTPTNNSYRALSFPDAKKIGVNLGARYQVNKKCAVDMIYAHVFTNSVRINDLNPASGALSSGYMKTNIDLIGAQLVWNI